MNVDIFIQQVQSLHKRVANLYRDANASVPPEAELLPAAFKELGIASEALEVAAARLMQQVEELAATRVEIEAEHERYRSLFESVPHAYLVSNAQGKIQEANRAAAKLFNVKQSLLGEKLLVSFLPVQERQAFRSRLNQLEQCDREQEWVVQMQPRQGEVFDAALSVTPIRDCEGKLAILCWSVYDITERQRTQLAILSHDYNPSDDRPRHYYSRGELISLEPQKIWLVCQGLVKLSTMSETGDEILVGLAGPSMPFSSGMTSLSIYQATALSKDVHLVCFSLEELAASPSLAQVLFAQISDRIRQTELLLAIAGKRHVKDRLYHLLLWLKEEFGQSVAQGIRLTVRLTHQDLADACCTTRVTITRELNKLQKQGKIMFDSQHHIIFCLTSLKQAA